MPPPGPNNPLPGGPTPNPLPDVLQPLNVQMAELIAAIKDLGDVTGAAGAAADRASASLKDLVKAFASLTSGISRTASVAAIAFTQLTKFTGAIASTVGHFVEAFSPLRVQLFAQTVRDTTAAVGQVLVPVLERFRVVVRGIGDAVVSLSPAARTMVGALAGAAVGMVTLTAVTEALSFAVASATGGISLIAGAVVGLAAGTGLLSGTMKQFQDVVRQVAGFGRDVFDALGAAFRAVFDAAQPLIAEFGRFVRAMSGPVVTAINQVAGAAAALVSALLPLGTELLSIYSEVLPEIAGLVGEMAGLAREVLAAFRPLIDEFKGELLLSVRVFAEVARSVAAGLRLIVAELRELLGLPAPAGPGGGRLGSSAGLGFVGVGTGSVESYLNRLQQNALAVGGAAGPQQQTAANTGLINGAVRELRTSVEKLPEAFARALAAEMRNNPPGGGAAGVLAPGAYGAYRQWQATREFMGRVFG